MTDEPRWWHEPLVETGDLRAEIDRLAVERDAARRRATDLETALRDLLASIEALPPEDYDSFDDEQFDRYDGAMERFARSVALAAVLASGQDTPT